MPGTWRAGARRALERGRPLLVLALFLGCAEVPPPALPAPPFTPVPASPPPSAPPPEPEPQSPLDPAVRSGVLPNGLTYFVMHRDEPVGRAALWLAVNAGSVLEDDDQRGLAHFVEHMAFNGTTHYPKHELVNFIERAGMTLGADVNATTSFDQTLYQLTLPTDREELVTQGIDVLHEIAHGVTFEPEEVDRERPVILEEWRMYRGARARAKDEQNPVLFAGSRYAEREPIGLPETIRAAPVSAMKRFYDEWYRPNLMGVIAVGDFDVQAVERALVERFSDLRNPEPARPRPVVEVRRDAPTQVAVHVDPDVNQAEITVYDRTPSPRLATRDDYRRHQIERLYVRILRARLTELTESPSSVLLRAAVDRRRLTRTLGVFAYSVTPRAGKLENALYVVLSELVRLGRYGVLPSELERERKELLVNGERVIEDENRAPLAGKASELVRHLFENEEVTGPAAELEALHATLPSITLEDVNRLARERALGAGRVVCATVPKGRKDIPTPASVRILETAAQDSALGPWRATTPEGPLVATPPVPGKILARSHDRGADAEVWTLSNGVRVVLKPTELSSGTVLVQGFQPGGTSLVTEDEYTAARYASSIVGADGAGTFGSRALATLLAGTGVDVELKLADFEQLVNARGRSDQLATLFQYLYLRLTSPRTDEMGTGGWKWRRTSGFYGRADESDNRFAAEVLRVSTQDHWRWRRPQMATVDAIDSRAVLTLWKRLFENFRGFTFVVVGRFDPAALESLVTTYLASLPSSAVAPTFKDPHVRYPSGVVESSIPGGIENKARFWLEFAGPVAYRPSLEDDVEIFGELLELRLREVLREELGGVYTFALRAAVIRRPAPRDALTIEFTCAPENLERLKRAIFDELEKITRDGIDDEALQLIRQRLARRDQTNRRSDHWWLARLTDAYRYGEDFAAKNDVAAAAGRVTRDNVRRTASLLFTPSHYVLVTMTPAGVRSGGS